jgi:pyruvate,water dikinase
LTKRTDPGWITLFPRASGLIVEHGSMLSHSFVVAREMGLPAVVGVENATAVIPDGAMVHLDGLKGEIIIEDSVILQAESVHSLQ